jgi:hypothetical protein
MLLVIMRHDGRYGLVADDQDPIALWIVLFGAIKAGRRYQRIKLPKCTAPPCTTTSTRRADMADRPQDAPRHVGHVVRRVLLRRNIAIDAETAQLVADAVQAALQPVTSASARSRCRQRAAGRSWVPSLMTFRSLDHDRGVTVIPLTTGYSRSRSITCQTAA